LIQLRDAIEHCNEIIELHLQIQNSIEAKQYVDFYIIIYLYIYMSQVKTPSTKECVSTSQRQTNGKRKSAKHDNINTRTIVTKIRKYSVCEMI